MVDRGPTLRGKLTLDTRPFARGLRGARTRSRKTFRGISQDSRSLTTALKGATAALAGFFVGRTVSNFLRAGESLERGLRCGSAPRPRTESPEIQTGFPS